MSKLNFEPYRRQMKALNPPEDLAAKIRDVAAETAHRAEGSRGFDEPHALKRAAAPAKRRGAATPTKRWIARVALAGSCAVLGSALILWGLSPASPFSNNPIGASPDVVDGAPGWEDGTDVEVFDYHQPLVESAEAVITIEHSANSDQSVSWSITHLTITISLTADIEAPSVSIGGGIIDDPELALVSAESESPSGTAPQLTYELSDLQKYYIAFLGPLEDDNQTCMEDFLQEQLFACMVSVRHEDDHDRLFFDPASAAEALAAFQANAPEEGSIELVVKLA